MAVDLAFLSASWAIASAAGVSTLGVLSMMGGQTRPRGAFAFGLFAVLWGAQIIVANALLLASPAAASRLFVAFLALLLPLPYFLVEFGIAQGRRAGGGATRAMRACALAPAALTVLLLYVDPSLVIVRVDDGAGIPSAVWGPLYGPLVQAPLFAAFGFALFALAGAFHAAPTPRTRVRSATLLAGLAVYVAFTAGNNLAFFALSGLAYPAYFGFTELLYVAIFSVLSVVVVTAGLRAWQAMQSATLRAEARQHGLVALALLAPLVWGVIEGALVMATSELLFTTVGLWRLVGVGIIAYGLARWRVYDLPQRATRLATGTTGAAAAASAGAVAYGAGAVAAGPALGALAGLLVAGGALLPSLRLARRLITGRVAPTQPDDAALYGQRIDAYRAALEASLARGTLVEDAPFLLALRERFEITDAEDRVLRYYARSSVIIPRSQNAWDAYDRLRLLGEGGGGRTWLARDRSRDRLVVLKEPLERWQVEPGAREMVLREARTAARVRHANVVAIEEVLEDKGAPVIAMEYLEGGSLADALRARGALPWREAVAVMVDVLAGVEAVHAAGIVHRDIKPSNVLLTREGVPKIADFGIAVSASSGKTAVMEVGSSTIAGTVAYMAPEARAGGPADKRSDLYSCAMLLHELVHGEPPRVGAPVLRRPDLPAGVLGAIAKGLAARPEERFPSARAFAEALVRGSG